MTLKDKYCNKCANQYTMKGCLTCFNGRHFKDVPKIDVSKLRISESGQIISEDNPILEKDKQIEELQKENKKSKEIIRELLGCLQQDTNDQKRIIML